MFFSHAPELIAVLLVGLIVFGPKRLPEIGSALGQGIRELKRGVGGVTAPEEPVQLSRDV
ncbi:MAG TPA: twin-arginine translocase TatA/TatE family subunit [Chloroflexota bacterium]|nr:twin-arginine translocase TatA/TatE family subunit [Chloroflexota bacterium]